MAEYVIQILKTSGKLVKSYEVTEECPLRAEEECSDDRTQIVLTNTDSYDGIVAADAGYLNDITFSYDDQTGKISCSGSKIEAWDKD